MTSLGISLGKCLLCTYEHRTVKHTLGATPPVNRKNISPKLKTVHLKLLLAVLLAPADFREVLDRALALASLPRPINLPSCLKLVASLGATEPRSTMLARSLTDVVNSDVSVSFSLGSGGS